jgi:hypothetical protein
MSKSVISEIEEEKKSMESKADDKTWKTKSEKQAELVVMPLLVVI